MEHLKNESSGLGTLSLSLSVHVNGKHRVARERENIACYMENERARERGSKRERQTAG